MASICANSTTSLNTYVSLHSKNTLCHSVFNFMPPITRYSHCPYTSTRCSNIRRPRPNYKPGRLSDPNYVAILDTTLRDGEQAPGAAMTSKEKLEIARQLAKLGVDVIEAGFPAASDADFELVKLVAQEVGNCVDAEGYVPVICALARSMKKDIDRAWEAIKYAKKPMVTLFIATSEIHMKYKLKMSREEVVERARSMVTYARSLGCEDVRFGIEDATRSDREFLYHVIGEVIKAGATGFCIGDTVGCYLPSEFGQLIADIKANTPGVEDVIISIHCHDDLGLATANTLAGVCAGARLVDVTVNGIGERAGNGCLEEIVMTLKCRGEQVLGGLYTGINSKHIIETSKMIEEYSGLEVQAHKAIVGANAFFHESSLHQDKEPSLCKRTSIETIWEQVKIPRDEMWSKEDKKNSKIAHLGMRTHAYMRVHYSAFSKYARPDARPYARPRMSRGGSRLFRVKERNLGENPLNLYKVQLAQGQIIKVFIGGCKK